MKQVHYAIAVLLTILVIIIIRVCKKKKEKSRRVWNDRFLEQNKVSMAESKKMEESSKDENNLILKIQMYIISLWLLFILIIPITVCPVEMEMLKKQVKWMQKIRLICKENILPIICLAMALIGYCMLRQLEYRWKGSRNLAVKITEVESENFEYLTFFTTYIIPLVCINLDEIRYIIVLFVLLVIIGIIFVKSDFYLGNPTLALVDYKLFRIRYEVQGKEYEKKVITKDRIFVGDYVESIPFDKNAWYVRKSE